MKHIPTEIEWRSVPWCLDIPYAYDHFFGKTLAEAIQLFEENAIYFQEDLMWMPKPCLSFYLDAYIDYLLGDSSAGDSDGASCFFWLIEIRHLEIGSFDRATISRTRQVLERLATRQSWYAADVEIYGDFRERAKSMHKLLG